MLKDGLGLRRDLTMLILGALVGGGVCAAPKTDVVVLLNGDRLTGEVKEMVQGKLRLNTDNADTIYIEWNKVATLQSRQRLQVELANGERHFGSAEPSLEPGQLRLKDGANSDLLALPLITVVQIYPLDEGKLLARLDGYLTAGYDYTKANNLQNFAFSGGLSSTQENRKWSVDASTAITTQDGANDTQRFDITGQYRHFLPKRWFWQGELKFESNDELALDLRTSVGGAYGRYLVQSHQHEWVAYAGANVTRENRVAEPNKHDLEGVIGTQYAFFHYDTPERTVYAQLDLLPSLTDSGRIRAGSKVRARFEIVKDFFFELSVYGNYDNRPGAHASSNSDYGTVTSLGYSF